MVGYRDAWKVIENFSSPTFAILEETDHGLSWEQKELYLALANDWLQRVEEFDEPFCHLGRAADDH